jgi:arylsulfatase A-like enzyme
MSVMANSMPEERDIRNGNEMRSNVLVIQPDQLRGAAMRCAGDEQIHTPNLDRLAAEGVRFTRAASASPVCSPFRGTLQTGLFPHEHGVVENDVRINLDKKGFAEVFAEAGYSTGYIGKWHLDGGLPSDGKGYVPPGKRRMGWQEWLGYEKAHEYFKVWKYDDGVSPPKMVRIDEYDWEPAWHTDMTLDFVRRNRDEKKPWLFYLAYGPPHVPAQCPDRFLDMYDPDEFVLPPDLAGTLSSEQEKELRRIWHIYYAQVTAVDHEIGRLMQGLKDLDVHDETLVIFTSDHGDHLGSHWQEHGKFRGKGSPFAHAFRIPLIVRQPGRIPKCRVCEALVSSVDLTPTILDLAGLPPIEGMQGESMAEWCLNGSGPSNEGVWIGLEDWRAVWDGRYLYARGGKYRLLYDHEKDPHETNNLFDDVEYKKTRERMHMLLLDLAKKASDPMLNVLHEMVI